MRKISIFLYLKQGIKGVLKFRIQFIVIVILSFLSTFILSLSLSSTKRIENNYESVMQKMDEFDYISSREVGIRNQTDSNFVPLNDFLNFQFLTTYNSEIEKTSLDNHSIQYNFNLIEWNSNQSSLSDPNIKQDYDFSYQSTFISKAFASEPVKTAFFDMLNNNNKREGFDPEQMAYLDLFFDYEYNQETGEIKYKEFENDYNIIMDNQYSYLVGDDKGNPKNRILSNFLLVFIEQLKNNLIVDLQNNEKYLENTLIYKLWNNNTVTKEILDVAPRDRDNLSPYSYYMYFAFISLAGQVIELTSNYLEYYIDQAVYAKDFDPKTQSIAEYFDANIAKEAGFKWITENNTADIANTLYAFITGQNYNELQTIKTEMLISETNLPWIQRLDVQNKTYTDDMFNETKKSIYQNGLRGSLVQIIGQTVPGEGIVPGTLNYSNPVYDLKVENGKQTTSEQLAGRNDFVDFQTRFDVNYEDPLIKKMYYFRNNLIGEALDIRIENRAEMLLSDSVDEIKYRLVVLDEYTWPDRVTLLGGRMPIAENEILINPQYAHKNKIKLGQTVQMGGGTFIVSGFATDPLAYYPISSTTEVYPNSKKTAIIYGTTSTLQKIVTFDFEKYTSKNLYTIVTMNDKNQNPSEKMAYFYANLMPDNNYLYSSYSTMEAINQNEPVGFQNPPSGEQYSSFNDSILAQNWKLAPMMNKYFKIVSFCLSVLISLIALIAIIIAIKKTIDLNSGEIGILKAMGVSAGKISISYLSYSFITFFIIVPLAWFAASFAQEIIVSLFLTYVGGLYNQVIFNWNALLISLFLFGIISMLVSYFVAYHLTSRKVLEVINKVEKHREYKVFNSFKRKLTKNMKFSSKLSTELAFSGFSKTLLTGTTVLFASFLTSGFLAIPGVVSQTLSSYYKNINYSNRTENIDLIGNAPLAKTNLTPWQGVDSYEDTYIPSNNIFGSGIQNISTSVSGSTSINDASVLPKIVISQSDDPNTYETKWLYDLFLNQDGQSSAESNVISILASIFGTNFVQLVGKDFSIMYAQQALEYIIHSQSFASASERVQEVTKLSDLLTTGLPNILSLVMPGAGSSQGGTWKEQITDIILGAAPSYVKNYLSISENRMNQYKFGYQFNSYIPNSDTMFTTLNAKNNQLNINLTGLLEIQNAFNLPKEKQNLFLNNEQLKKLENIVYGRTDELEDIFINNFKVYDANSRTLTMPTIVNGEFELANKFTNNLIENLVFPATRLMLTEGSLDIPNSAWKYDDRDYVYLKSHRDHKLTNEEGWLNPEELQSSKFTYQAIFKDNNSSSQKDWGYKEGFDRYQDFNAIRDNSFAFFDFEQDNDQLKPIIRPYYQYDNIVLFVPEEVSSNFQAMAALGNIDQTAWFGKVTKSQVPNETVKDWEKILGKEISNFTWIRPYSYYFDASDQYSKAENNLTGSEIDALINSKTNFLAKSFQSTKNPFKVGEQNLDWKIMSKNNLNQSNIEQINLQKVGSIDVYGSPLAIIDQNIANLMKGYSTAKYIPFNFSYENLDSGVKTVDVNGTNIDTYQYYKPRDMLSTSRQDEWIYGLNPKQKAYIPSVWYNGVFANEEEPYFITTQVSFARNIKIGEDTISSEQNFKAGIEIDAMNFLSEQQNLINELTNLVLTIGIFFICFIIFVTTLSIVLISDIYVQQYKKFMITMKSLGYSNWKIIKYSFGFVSVFSLITFTVGTVLSQFAIIGVASYINKNFMAIPYGITWWLPFISSILIIGSYVISIAITTSKIRKESPSVLVI